MPSESSANESPRLGRAHLNDEVVEPLFRGHLSIIDGLPDDARFKRMFRDVQTGSYAFIFESAEFDPVPQGEEIPRIELSIRTDAASQYVRGEFNV